jgi:galactose oxidase
MEQTLFTKISKKSTLRLSTAILIALSESAMGQTPTEIQLNNTPLCADVSGESLSQGASVISWNCKNSANQQWRLSPSGNGYALINQNSNLCMDVSGASTAAGAPIIQWACWGGANQNFSLTTSGGGVEIIASHSGMCVSSADTTSQGPQLTQQVCNATAQQIWNVASQNTLASYWSAPITLPIVPVAAANLPDGRVLVWSADNSTSFTPGEVSPGTTYTTIFDPTTNSSSEVIVSNTGHDMFCPGIANLPDGRIFVTGGSTSAAVSIYDPHTYSWSSAQPMNIPRAYQGSLTLSNGGVFVLGGSWNGGLGNKNGETWFPNTGWQENSAVLASAILTNDAQGVYRADNHVWMFADSNGWVFQAGPSKTMHWINTAGNGSITAAAPRGNDNDAMNGNAVLYDIGKILTVGGAPSYENSDATANANLISFRGNSGAIVVTPIGPMHYRRAFSNSVVLPNGEVVVMGGETYPVTFSDDTAVLTPELFNPADNSFTLLAMQAIPRTYHSIGLLLPDGRVLSGGGGLCGNCSTNHPDVEILTPPYLLNSDGSPAPRPTITSAPNQATLGSTITVTTDSAVSAFVLMRFSSVTHSINNEQRRVPVSFSTNANGSYQLNIPSDNGVLITGYYMLFALYSNGVPSVASTIQIQ